MANVGESEQEFGGDIITTMMVVLSDDDQGCKSVQHRKLFVAHLFSSS